MTALVRSVAATMIGHRTVRTPNGGRRVPAKKKAAAKKSAAKKPAVKKYVDWRPYEYFSCRMTATGGSA
jgi:hypothetical protein